MSRPFQLLLGPELLWVIFYFLLALLVRISGAPAKNLDDSWLSLTWIVPFVLVPLTFGLWFIPAVERDWLLLRVWIAGIFGANYVLEKGLGAHSEQGPGVGTAYILAMGLVFFVLIGGSVFVKIRF